MALNELIASAAQKGAAMGPQLGRMCSTCAFRLNSEANLEEDNVEAAAECLAFYGMFHCHGHQRDANGNLPDAGHPCAGFLYAKRYMDSIAE